MKCTSHQWNYVDGRVAPNSRGNSGHGRTVCTERRCALCGRHEKKEYVETGKLTQRGLASMRGHWHVVP